MTTVYIADTGVFVRCGGSDKDKFQRLRRALRQAGVSLRVPQRVYEELGGDPAADEYPSGNIPYPDGFEEGWIVVANELDYTNPLVSTVMDKARRFIANETDRDEDVIEKARHGARWTCGPGPRHRGGRPRCSLDDRQTGGAGGRNAPFTARLQ